MKYMNSRFLAWVGAGTIIYEKEQRRCGCEFSFGHAQEEFMEHLGRYVQQAFEYSFESGTYKRVQD